MTKYMAGHGDALAGIVVGRDEEVRAQIHYMRILMGGILAPMERLSGAPGTQDAGVPHGAPLFQRPTGGGVP